MSQDGSKADKKGVLNPYAVTAPGAGPSPNAQPENRQPVFPSQQSDPSVFDQSDPNQLSRHLTPESTGVTVNLRPGSSGSSGIRGDARRTITEAKDAPEAFPQGIVPSDAGAGSPFGIGPQSEAYVKRSRIVTNPAGKGETEK
jgi:hypothetical protein